MANNRMYLVHPGSGQRIMLAKYYPSTGWYPRYEDVYRRLSEGFHAVDFPGRTWEQVQVERVKAPGGMLGDTSWRIEYETDNPDSATVGGG